MANRLGIKDSDIYDDGKVKTIDKLCTVIKNKLIKDNRML